MKLDPHSKETFIEMYKFITALEVMAAVPETRDYIEPMKTKILKVFVKKVQEVFNLGSVDEFLEFIEPVQSWGGDFLGLSAEWLQEESEQAEDQLVEDLKKYPEEDAINFIMTLIDIHDNGFGPIEETSTVNADRILSNLRDWRLKHG